MCKDTIDPMLNYKPFQKNKPIEYAYSQRNVNNTNLSFIGSYIGSISVEEIHIGWKQQYLG